MSRLCSDCQYIFLLPAVCQLEMNTSLLSSHLCYRKVPANSIHGTQRKWRDIGPMNRELISWWWWFGLAFAMTFAMKNAQGFYPLWYCSNKAILRWHGNDLQCFCPAFCVQNCSLCHMLRVPCYHASTCWSLGSAGTDGCSSLLRS